ncbi:nuclear transport factor 2 family protein [Puniceibacterium sp. IMCC21224]|uniref:nuclear transport factor 2 family protein n=1 Tax=Puniceibacterium sp. IMCC21224 TaxID=1618204 RepID=UPI00064DFB78|nr:nuclear transport factor 2 family protein [Puniceibacterium sp. IMCC21224]KMK69063.1 ketosteroid isomerase-like protein [Puniceibacterium sp. IMCC21224]
MSIEQNIRTVQAFFAAIGAGDKEVLFALVDPEIEWIIPGDGWPLAGTHRGHAGLTALLETASKEMETSFAEPPEYVAQGERVLVIGTAEGTVTATGKAWVDNWVFTITVRDGKLTNIREYIDTQALARASKSAAGPSP